MGTPGSREWLPTGLQQERGGLSPVPQNEPTRMCPQRRRPGEGGPPSGVSLTVEAATVIRVLWEESAWWTRPWSPAGTARPRFTWLSSLPVGSSLGLRPRAQAAPPPHGTLPRTSEPALARLSGYVTPSVFSSQVSLCGKDSSCLVCCPVAQACLTK